MSNLLLDEPSEVWQQKLHSDFLPNVFVFNRAGQWTQFKTEDITPVYFFHYTPDAIVVAYDLSRGGGLFQFNGAATIKSQAFYVQDEIKAGNATFKLGLRGDRYDGLSSSSLFQPSLAPDSAVLRLPLARRTTRR